MFEGEHNEKRPLHILQVISLFFYNHLKVENIVEISLAYDKNKKNNLNTINSVYDEEETNDIDEDLNILNDEGDCKRENIKVFYSNRPKVKSYFETI